MSSPAQSQVTDVFSGFVQELRVNACKLNSEDLRQLYARLQRKAEEAAELQLQIAPPATPQDGKNIRDSMRLAVRVQSPNGEWLGGQSRDVLEDKNLLAEIEVVEFFSALAYRTRFNADPNHWFTVRLDFRRPRLSERVVGENQRHEFYLGRWMCSRNNELFSWQKDGSQLASFSFDLRCLGPSRGISAIPVRGFESRSLSAFQDVCK